MILGALGAVAFMLALFCLFWGVFSMWDTRPLASVVPGTEAVDGFGNHIVVTQVGKTGVYAKEADGFVRVYSWNDVRQDWTIKR